MQPARDIVSGRSELTHHGAPEPGTDLPHHGAPEPGTELSPRGAPEPGTELSPNGALEHEVVPEPGQACLPSTLETSSRDHVLTSQNSVCQPAAMLLENAPGQEASADPYSSCHACPDCHQFSNLHPILSRLVPHKDKSVRAPLDRPPLRPVSSVPPNPSVQTEPAEASQELRGTDIHNAQIYPPVVCTPSPQAVGVTDVPAVSQHDIYSPGFVSTQETNHHSVFDARDDIKQSLIQNVDHSKPDVPQPYQMSLVHDEAVKLAWATTQGCLLEVLKGKLRHRKMSGTLHADLLAGSRDVCIVEDVWNLADPNMVSDVMSGRSWDRMSGL